MDRRASLAMTRESDGLAMTTGSWKGGAAKEGSVCAARCQPAQFIDPSCCVWNIFPGVGATASQTRQLFVNDTGRVFHKLNPTGVAHLFVFTTQENCHVLEEIGQIAQTHAMRRGFKAGRVVYQSDRDALGFHIQTNSDKCAFGFNKGLSCQQTDNRNIFIHFGPVSAFTITQYFAISPITA